MSIAGRLRTFFEIVELRDRVVDLSTELTTERANHRKARAHLVAIRQQNEKAIAVIAALEARITELEQFLAVVEPRTP